ncbi:MULTISPECIES: RagB/SusD family nutrient uptake outer membrane protein [Chryseobacterium]|uniref:RagB/SusD family nutrient uptake outer membrane protein n=1 Tax=Chryseobacterium TaxID=59732 RepID=UPI0016265D7E|nr:RagB/SusD family nutrient uptake outer membrane protein [Chryseobacterium indologenes]MBF6643920.1 RagB/SusD family nutrient uptake outer membrane protein [Chryseobacterium indologenes]MBU3046785.1 RagB/SusD family nutrient uptake outer membrane protein [Chryseobacterium indologenes]QQQ72352.1 RagB/SusD family nutrient uptake outer membrane protein [Chryseobacterium indologenes]
MTNPIKYISVVLVLLSVSMITHSCEKLVETDFPNNQIPSQLVFEDEQTAESALAGLYSALWNNSMYSGGIDGMGALLGTYTDDLNCVYTSASNGALDLYNNQQIPTNTAITSFWTYAYQEIYMANSIIEGVSGSKALSTATKNRIRGEAMFVRSLLYLNLYEIFGEIPYTDTTDYAYNSQLTRMAKNELLSKLEADLSEAVNLLPADYRTIERIYPNKFAGYLVLAKMKMELKKWSEAENLCNTILQSNLYSFQTDITKVFQKGGMHIIWQLKPKNTNDATKEASLYTFTGAPTSFTLSSSLVNTFAANDLRRQNYMTAVPFSQQTNYRSSKYKNLGVNNATEYSVLFRLDEVYLIKAEILLEMNRVTEAVPFINRSRQRAGLSLLNSSISVTEAKSQMRDEKRREFFTEHGIRFFDLKRWGVLDQLNAVKPNWKSYHSSWPLPQKELLVNPKLNPQNTGY